VTNFPTPGKWHKQFYSFSLIRSPGLAGVFYLLTFKRKT